MPYLKVTPREQFAHYEDRLRRLAEKVSKLPLSQQNLTPVHVCHDECCPMAHDGDGACCCTPDLVARNVITGKELAAERAAMPDYNSNEVH